MNFQTESQKNCYTKLADWLPQVSGCVVSADTGNPIFSLRLGSAIVLVEVRPFREVESIIYIWTYVATEVETRNDLLRYLLNQNDGFRFGGFSMADDGDVKFHVTLLGASCEQNELNLALTEVLETADRYDDTIVERWGGRRSTDSLF